MTQNTAFTAPEIHGLYVIPDPSLSATSHIIQQVELALKGGARIIQYRDKTSTYNTQLNIAKRLKILCKSYQAWFIINDNIALALASKADGIHIGRNDCDLETARQALGDEAIIGVTCYNDLARAKAMQDKGANYVAFGRFYPSQTKPKAPQASLDTLIEAKALLTIPIVAIGGININNAVTLLETGVDSLAVIQGVFAQPCIESAASHLSQLFKA